MGPLRRRVLLRIAWMLATCQAVGIASAGEGGRGAEIVWARDFEAALEQASIEGRPVVVDFYASWCGWCKKLDRETFVDPEVVRRSRLFVFVKVSGEKRTDLAHRYRVRAYPSIAFLQQDGRIDALVRGYQPPSRFAEILDRHLDSRAREFTLRQRLKDHPELYAVRYDLARLLVRRGARAEAIAEFDSLAVRRSEIPADLLWEIQLEHGRALHLAGRSEEARPLLRAFVEKQPDSNRLSEAIYFLAEASLEGGRREEARKWYRRLLGMVREGWLAERSRVRLGDLGGEVPEG